MHQTTNVELNRRKLRGKIKENLIAGREFF